jgi:hypothetical protein
MATKVCLSYPSWLVVASTDEARRIGLDAVEKKLGVKQDRNVNEKIVSSIYYYLWWERVGGADVCIDRWSTWIV